MCVWDKGGQLSILQMERTSNIKKGGQTYRPTLFNVLDIPQLETYSPYFMLLSVDYNYTEAE